MSNELWAKRVSGEECPFCSPREDVNAFWEKIETLNETSLYLSKDQRFKGRCLLILNGGHQIGFTQLEKERAMTMFEDLRIASLAIEKATGCELLNVASLGNQIAHLHWHIIPRFKNDARWGAPPWTTHSDDIPAHQLSDTDFKSLKEKVMVCLEQELKTK